MMTVNRLKKSCMVAPPSARLNSSFLVMWPKATSMQVTVVPMFAPMIIGTALLIESTPEATKATTIDVVVPELWIILVTKIPINKPTKGFEVVAIRPSAKGAPKPLKAWLIRLMLTRNA